MNWRLPWPHWMVWRFRSRDHTNREHLQVAALAEALAARNRERVDDCTEQLLRLLEKERQLIARRYL